MAVIWDFEPTTGMTGAAIQPEETPADHMVSVPRLAYIEQYTVQRRNINFC